MSNLEEKISSFVQEHGLFDRCIKVLVAVSGGVDSMVLLDILAKIKPGKVAVAHVNHNLRATQSDGDEAFVKETCGKLGVECFSESVDVKGYAKDKKLSIETAARQLRQQAFKTFLKSSDCDAIATGHHTDDNAETVIHRLLRGTGYRGLAGINPKRVIDGMTFISPMLSSDRKEIIEYAQQNNIAWRQDHTNDDCQFTRNKIRHLLIPVLQNDSKGNIVEALSCLSEKCARLNTRINEQIDSVEVLKITGDTVTIEIETLTQQPKLVQAEIIRQALQLAGSGLRNITEEHYENIIGLCYGSGGRRIELPGSFAAEKQFDLIAINSKFENRNSRQIQNSNIQKPISIDEQIEFENYLIDSKLLCRSECSLKCFINQKDEYVEWFDADRINGGIIVRQRVEGDRFTPIGTTAEQKVGKFLTAGKIRYETREEVVIFEDLDKIVWVCPVRACNEAKVTSDTKKILQVRVTRKHT